MAGDIIGSRYDELRLIVHLGDLRRAVVVGRFALRIGGALDFPDGLAGVFVDGKNIRRIFCFHAVENLHVKPVAFEQRRGRIAVVQSEAPVVRLDIAFWSPSGVQTRDSSLTWA